IDRLVRAKGISIIGIRARGRELIVVARRAQRIGRFDERVLPLTDLPLDRPRTRAIGARRELRDNRLDVGGIENRKAALERKRRCLLANDREAEAVERRYRNGRGRGGSARLLQRILRALAHFARRLVRERDRDDLRWLDAAFDEMRDLRGDDARLATAGAGEHEQRRVVVAHGFALRGVEGELQGGAARGVATMARIVPGLAFSWRSTRSETSRVVMRNSTSS